MHVPTTCQTKMQEKHHKGLGKECCSHFIRYSFCSLFVVLTLASLFILYEIQILYHTEIRGFILGNNVVASGVGLTGNNNVILLFDEHTRSLSDGNFKKQSVSPFTELTSILQAIHNANKSLPIKLVISTDGGNLINAKNIIRHLRLHPSGYTVYCNEAFSAGSLVALTAKEIVMNNYSFMGKIDPIISGEQQIIHNNFYQPNISSPHPISHLDYVIRRSSMAMNTMEKILREFVPEYDRLERVIKENLIYSELLHADSFNFWEMKEMGFRVRVPSEEEEVYFGYFQAK